MCKDSFRKTFLTNMNQHKTAVFYKFNQENF